MALNPYTIARFQNNLLRKVAADEDTKAAQELAENAYNGYGAVSNLLAAGDLAPYVGAGALGGTALGVGVGTALKHPISGGVIGLTGGALAGGLARHLYKKYMLRGAGEKIIQGMKQQEQAVPKVASADYISRRARIKQLLMSY